MPYEVSFTKPVAVQDPDRYINDCCYGGDVVVERLLPAVSQRSIAVQTNQEDWGWFIWFRDGSVSLAIDVFCDGPESGAFRLHLTSRTRRWLFFGSVVDTPELERVRELVESQLVQRTRTPCRVVRSHP
jgi:hypothetical protein